jgi:hypothetical protein
MYVFDTSQLSSRTIIEDAFHLFGATLMLLLPPVTLSRRARLIARLSTDQSLSCVIGEKTIKRCFQYQLPQRAHSLRGSTQSLIFIKISNNKNS